MAFSRRESFQSAQLILFRDVTGSAATALMDCTCVTRSSTYKSDALPAIAAELLDYPLEIGGLGNYGLDVNTLGQLADDKKMFLVTVDRQPQARKRESECSV